MTSLDIAHQRLLNQHIARPKFEKPGDEVGWLGAVQARDYAVAKWVPGLLRQVYTMKALEFRFAFYARDFDRSVHFYQDILSMTYLSGWDRADGKGALLSVGGTAVIEIYGAAEGKMYDGPAPVALNLALRLASVADVNDAFEQLSSAGARVAGPPENRTWGHHLFIVFDPDDLPIHVYCELD